MPSIDRLALLLVAVGLAFTGWQVPATRLWILVPALVGWVATLLTLGGGSDVSGGSGSGSRAHPVFRRWVEGRFPFEE